MNKIKISLEYRCFPIWLYDQNNCFIDNELPNELIEDETINCLCIEIQDEYDSLFIDNDTKFQFIGFSNPQKKEQFRKKLTLLKDLLKKQVGENYIIEIVNFS